MMCVYFCNLIHTVTFLFLHTSLHFKEWLLTFAIFLCLCLGVQEHSNCSGLAVTGWGRGKRYNPGLPQVDGGVCSHWHSTGIAMDDQECHMWTYVVVSLLSSCSLLSIIHPFHLIRSFLDKIWHIVYLLLILSSLSFLSDRRTEFSGCCTKLRLDLRIPQHHCRALMLRPYQSVAWYSAPEKISIGILVFLIGAICNHLSMSLLDCLCVFCLVFSSTGSSS